MILKKPHCLFKVITLLFLGHSLFSQGAIPKDLTDLFKHETFTHAQVALSVVDIESGEHLIGYNDQVALIPASSQKVLTTYTSLRLLGKEYSYTTKVESHGALLSDGTLDGDIVIIGSGDPSLGSLQMNLMPMETIIENIVSSIIKSGIKCIDGQIICDVSIFDKFAIADSWSWDDICNYYASGAYGLNIIDNSYEIDLLRSDIVGNTTSISHIRPNVPGLQLDNHVTIGTHGSGDNAYLYGDPYSYIRSIRGTIPPGKSPFTIKGAIPNPALLFIQYLRSELMAVDIYSEGIDIQFKSSEKVDMHSRLLYSIQSPNLIDLVRETNFYSINLFAEALLKTLNSKEGQTGSFEGGIDKIEEYLRSIGIDERALQMKDGSGLSTQNRLTTNLLSEFMAYMHKSFGVKLATELLPKAGYEGSVRTFLQGYTAKNNVWVKSGSMSGVISYAGYIHTKKGNWVSVSVISNGHSSNGAVRKLFEQMFNYIYLTY